jgi:hypothetical protein
MRRAGARRHDRLVSTDPRTAAQECDLKVSFDELTLIYKSLLAARALGVLSQEEQFVDDTIQLVDQALNAAI